MNPKKDRILLAALLFFRRHALPGSAWRYVDSFVYAFGALLAGVTADALGLSASMWIVAGLTAVSGLVAAARMTETNAGNGP